MVDKDQAEVPWEILAEPLVEILSVNVLSTTPKDRSPLKVYGEIYVRDRDSTYYLYDRDEDEPETIPSGTPLTLSGPEDCVIPATGGFLVMNLWDLNAENSSIVLTCVLLENETEDDYEKLMVKQVQTNNHYTVSVQYIVFPCAIMACAEVELTNNSSATHQLHGRIFAFYQNTYQLEINDNEHLPTVLFTKSFDKPQEVGPDTRTTLELSRPWLAVSPYASLVIKFELWGWGDKKPVVEETPPFKYSSEIRHEFSVRDVVIKLTIKWFENTLKPFISRRMQPQKIPIGPSLDLFWDRIRPSLDEQGLIFRNSSGRILYDVVGEPMTEVFSVFIGRKSDQNVELYGNIRFKSLTWCYNIFDKVESTPELLAPCDKNLSIEGPPAPEAFIGLPLFIELNLKDKRSSLSITGKSSWSEGALAVYKVPKVDRRLCAVYHCLHGYAVIHYMMIWRAVLASLDININYKGTYSDASIHVQGNIVAQYGDHEYKTRYDKEYYRSVLFKERSGIDLTMKQGKCKVPLRKAVVCVPKNSFLVLEVDITSGDGFTFKNNVEFKLGETYKKIDIEDQSIEIHVVWRDRDGEFVLS